MMGTHDPGECYKCGGEMHELSNCEYFSVAEETYFCEKCLSTTSFPTYLPIPIVYSWKCMEGELIKQYGKTKKIDEMKTWLEHAAEQYRRFTSKW